MKNDSAVRIHAHSSNDDLVRNAAKADAAEIKVKTVKHYKDSAPRRHQSLDQDVDEAANSVVDRPAHDVGADDKARTATSMTRTNERTSHSYRHNGSFVVPGRHPIVHIDHGQDRMRVPVLAMRLQQNHNVFT